MKLDRLMLAAVVGFVLLVVALFVGFFLSDDDSKEPEVSDAQVADELVADVASGSRTTKQGPDTASEDDEEPLRGIVSNQSFTNLGVKSNVLLQVMNANHGYDKELHHYFEHLGDNDDCSMYKDRFNSIFLTLVGPKNDLLCIELTIPAEEFFDFQADGTATGDGAGAFGRCVQRLGLAIDPSWAEDLYLWMNEKMGFALITKEGATLRYKHLIAVFDTDELPDGTRMVNFAIGVPENEGPAK